MQPRDQLLLAAVILGGGIITFCVCLPLIYRKVPMIFVPLIQIIRWARATRDSRRNL